MIPVFDDTDTMSESEKEQDQDPADVFVEDICAIMYPYRGSSVVR